MAYGSASGGESRVVSKSLVLWFTAVVAVVGSAGQASAQTGWYVSGSLGGYFRQNVSGPDTFFHEDDPSATAPGSDRIRFDASALVGNVAVGYRLSSHLRVEGELGYDRHHPESLTPSTAAPGFPELNGQSFQRQLGDDYSRFTGEVNGFYDIATFAGRFTPYVGAGVGGSDNRQSEGLFEARDGTPFNVSGGSSTEGFAMAEGGLAIGLTPRLSLVPAYRYVRYFAGGEDVANVAKLALRLDF